MKKYKIEAFRGYESFVKKVGNKEGYIGSISWTCEGTILLLELRYPGIIMRSHRGGATSYCFSPCVKRELDKEDLELGDARNMVLTAFNQLYSDLKRMTTAYKEGEK